MCNLCIVFSPIIIFTICNFAKVQMRHAQLFGASKNSSFPRFIGCIKLLSSNTKKRKLRRGLICHQRNGRSMAKQFTWRKQFISTRQSYVITSLKQHSCASFIPFITSGLLKKPFILTLSYPDIFSQQTMCHCYGAVLEADTDDQCSIEAECIVASNNILCFNTVLQLNAATRSLSLKARKGCAGHLGCCAHCCQPRTTNMELQYIAVHFSGAVFDCPHCCTV